MSQSLAQIYLHIIFSTSERRSLLQDPKVRAKMHGYLHGICEKQDCPPLAIGGVADHVHIACRLSKTGKVADVVKELKRSCSIWIKTKFSNQQSFAWQAGYGAFSISPSHLAGLQEYIANQEAHHRRETFQNEFRRLLKKYHVEYDERYVWD